MVFKFLLILLVVLLVIRMFNRLTVSSYVYTNDKNKTESHQTREEGSVSLEKNEKTEKLIGKDEGEYVDYEEVK